MPRIAPLLVSVLVHGSAVALAAAYLRERPDPAREDQVIALEVREVTAIHAPEVRADAPAAAPAPSHPRAGRMRPRSGPRAMATRDAPGAAEAPVPQFALSNAAAPRAAAPGATAAGDEVYPEDGVNVPARLLSAAAIVYPPRARAAEVELDVPLEIVVDPRGQVAQARVLTPRGYGLDEAALGAVRAYRFSPALRGGRPVPVRMRWVVQFRLR